MNYLQMFLCFSMLVVEYADYLCMEALFSFESWVRFGTRVRFFEGICLKWMKIEAGKPGG